MYTTDARAQTPLYLALIQQWLLLFDHATEATKDIDKFSWFFFRLIIKSLAIDLQDWGLLADSASRKNRLSEECAKKLESLFEVLIEEIRGQARANLSLAR